MGYWGFTADTNTDSDVSDAGLGGGGGGFSKGSRVLGAMLKIVSRDFMEMFGSST